MSVADLFNIKILDGHNDGLKKAYLTGESILSESNRGQFDVPRAMRAGLRGGVCAILTPSERPEEREFGWGLKLTEDGWQVQPSTEVTFEFASRFVDDVLDAVLDPLATSELAMLVNSFDDLAWCMENDRFGVILHLEGAEAIRRDLSNLDYFHERGLRSLGIVWSRPNAFGYGTRFKFPSRPDGDPGLTEAGRRLVRRCNELKIGIDLAHITEMGFWDTAGITDAPLVVSHSGAHAVCPSSTNLLDSQIDEIGKSEGVVGIIFDVLSTRPDGRMETNSSLDFIVDHIEYIANRIGIGGVAFGSDFDGGQMPAGLSTVENMPLLLERLESRGFRTKDIQSIAFGNWMRVWERTW